MAPVKKTIVQLAKTTETDLAYLLTNQKSSGNPGQPFPGSPGVSSSEQHEQFIKDLLSGDPTTIETAVKTTPAHNKISDDGEIARIIHIVQSVFQEPSGGHKSVGVQTYEIIRDMLANCAAAADAEENGDDDPDPTWY